jgi:hypothetical protein
MDILADEAILAPAKTLKYGGKEVAEDSKLSDFHAVRKGMVRISPIPDFTYP